MINHISIKDFAIIENIDIDLHPGLNIITGETGAGKSIIIEAISMALGERADTTMVRSGRNKAIIQIAAENDDGELIISREINSSGKSLSKVNGSIISLNELTQVAGTVADIHGQYDNQSLLDRDNHIDIVDLYYSEFIGPAKEKVKTIYSQYAKVKKQLDDLLKNDSDTKRQLDFLRYEINEIEAANPQPGEDEQLNREISIMENSEKIHDKLTESYTDLKTTTPSAIDLLGKTVSSLEELSNISEEFKDMAEKLKDVYYETEDVGESIREYLDKVDYSKQTLDDALNRLDTLDRLKSKYGGTINSVIEYQDEANKKLDAYENIDKSKDELQQTIEKLKEELKRDSSILSDLRKKASENLSEKIQIELEELNFSDAKFQIHFDQIHNIENAFSSNGVDQLEFLLSANKGLPPLPLAKIASGGEMSRIMLALKTVIGKYDSIPTMIFDEIDNGISGITASIVGEKLLKMSKTHQIICITHLPQIAAYADHHYVIKKNSDDESTYTTIEEIYDDSRIREIARLLGGKNITESTLNNARELVEMSS